ncbi:putative transmembrane protein [Helianthus annuus]|nr:putative transmembrane protein [Helianthus annuus]
MAYADHAFSIFDEDIMMDSDSAYTTHNRIPVKKIALTVSLLGVIVIVSSIIMVVNCVHDNTRSVIITIVSSFLNLPFIISLFMLKICFLFD